MAENVKPSDDMSWHPAMRPDTGEVPVATTDARDLGTTSENDTTEPLIPPPVSGTPADNIESPEDGAVVEAIAPGDVHEQTAANDEPDSNRIVDAQVGPELNPSPEGPRPDETPTSTTGGDDDETTQPVAEALANEDGQAFFNQLHQQNGVEHDPFADPVPAEPSAGFVVQEQTQRSEVHDNAVDVEDHENGQQPFATDGEPNDADGAFWENLGDDTGDGDGDFFDQLKTQTKPIYMPPEPESRYEEGVPLLNQTPQTPVEPTEAAQPESTTTANAEPTTAKAEAQIDSVFAADEDEGDDFFSQVQQSEPKPEVPSHISRKSTPQIMESVGEPLDSPINETSPTAQGFNEMLAAPKQVRKSSEEDLAARWQAELSDTEEPVEDDLAARWQAELDDDDDLLMDGIDGETTTTGQERAIPNFPGTASYTAPSGLNGPESSRAFSSYTPHQPPTSNLFDPPATAQPIPPPVTSYFPPQPPVPRPDAVRAESFTGRSKEGYKSPYDVPENLARPRRPAKPVISAAGPAPPTSTPPIGSMPPPPRSSSIPATPPVASQVPPPPIGAPPQMGSPPPAAAAAAAAAPPLAPSKGFYEELPLPPPRARSRPASSGRYTPNPNAMTTAPAVISQPPPPPPNPYSNFAPSPQLPSETPEQPQLHPAEQSDPYVNSLAPPPAPPSASSRYSPKPGGLQPGTKPPSTPRYSPAPPPSSAGSSPRSNRYVAQPSSAPGPGLALPFQPRTSSPLAYHEKASYQPGQPESRPSLEPAASLSPPNRFQPRPSLDQGSPRISVPAAGDGADPVVANADVRKETSPLENQQRTSPPRNIYAPPSYVNGFANGAPPSDGAPTVPAIGAPEAGESQFVPPRRSQTQSPSKQMMGPKLSVPTIDPLQRPASVHGSGSPTKTISPYAPAQASARSRAASMRLDFVPPTDEQQTDPLERWKGAPIVTFGFGGSITSSFPMHIPRYSAGQAAPVIKSCPGEVKIGQLNNWLPPTEGIVAHPGPLKNKSKKKDVLNWLSSKIAAFENEGLSEGAELYPDSQKRHEEKILLWKIVRVLVEKDGVLEGLAEVQKALRDVIFPHLQNADADQTYGNGISQPLNAPAQPDAVDPRSIDVLRDNLVLGEREKAVWGAVDNRLWGHAMIIASSLDKALWKQVVQEFVRREVKSATSNTESLAALYEIFAGNVEESVDELVPPSARAGLQMVSTVNGQESSKNALDGLDSWKDTLGMVLSNRSPEDYQALLALGRLLLSYGRVEAAHICMIFSRAALFGGADDPQASIVLLGANHQHFPSTFMHDEDAILLTEVYEFATSILASLPQATLPHLTGFKLQYAWTLADRDRKSEAQQYCDAIAAALKASTRPSGYYHQHLFTTLGELSARLSQTTADGGSSWISKPSMEKVSGSMWARFNSFVAGEDSDAASTGSGKNADADVGPFAKVAGTPTVSRSPSMSDMYGSYPGPGPQPIPAHGASRYHPSNSQYARNSSPEHFRGRSSMDSQRSFGLSFGRRGSQEPTTPGENNYYPGGSLYNSPLAGYQSTPPQTSYMPLAPVEEDLPSQPEVPSGPMQTSSIAGSPYQPSMYTPETYPQPFGDQTASNQAQPTFGYMPAHVDSYGPPIDEVSGTSAPQEEGYVEEEKPKKSMMDDDEDDDDMAVRAVALQKAEKERQDREAEEAFKKAAEADANRPVPSKKSSWLGGLFSKKKEPEPNAGGGPIRAKLGEENSFYYDTELKKWVNKKDPNSATPSATPPPPPKRMGPPSRATSAASVASTPPMMSSRPSSSAGPGAGAAPPSIAGSPGLSSSLGAPPTLPRSVSTGAAAPTASPPGSSAGSAPGLGLAPPPPRPSTSLSNASSIDDLLGAPTARKGAAGGKGKKKGRYVDVMAQ